MPQSWANVEHVAFRRSGLSLIDRYTYHLRCRRHIKVPPCIKETEGPSRLNNHRATSNLAKEYLDNLLLGASVLRQRGFAGHKILHNFMRDPPGAIVGPQVIAN